MQNSNMIISIFMFYYQKKGIPSENPFLFWKELLVIYYYCIRLKDQTSFAIQTKVEESANLSPTKLS